MAFLAVLSIFKFLSIRLSLLFQLNRNESSVTNVPLTKKLVGAHDTSRHGMRNGMLSIRSIKFCDDILNMKNYGAFRDTQNLRDFPVRFSFSGPIKTFQFTFCKYLGAVLCFFVKKNVLLNALYSLISDPDARPCR